MILVDRIPLSVPVLGGNAWRYLKECVDTEWVSYQGPFVPRFEEAVAAFVGTRYAVATNSGTAALHLSLHSVGIRSGDEVIVPALTFIATANAVVYTGAIPVFADVDPETWTMDPDSVRQCISPRTRAIIPVHLFGMPAEMDPIRQIAADHGLIVIEDAAQALGATYKGKRVGSLGKAGCLSFNGNKVITSGGGGMIVTDDQDLAERARFLSMQARSGPGFFHPEVGFNYRLTNLQAALGLAQIEDLSQILDRKKAIADLYAHRLSEIGGLTLARSKPWTSPSHWLNSVLVQDAFGTSRDQLIDFLTARNIESRPFFQPLNTLPPYRGCRGTTPVAEELGRRGLNLPSSASLSDEDVVSVCEAISSLHREHRLL